MKIAAAYIRVSTDMQTEYSPDSQLRLIKEYAEKNKFVVPTEFIFADEGISGRKAEKRPAFQKMIACAKQKQFDAILVYSTSRFARNLEDSIVYKSMLQKECNIDVISITQPFVDRKTDMLTNAIYGVLDEWYSIDLAENVKRGMTEKAMRGGYQCSPPFGYVINTKKAPPEVVPEEAKIVQIIYDMFLGGKHLFSISHELNDMGFSTRKGNLWERRSIERILKNPIYKGYVCWNKCNNNSGKINDPSQWIVTKGTHEPIISEEKFEEVQSIFSKKSSVRSQRPPMTYKHWLSGVLKCGHCGKTLAYSYNKSNGYTNFHCSGYNKGLCKHSNGISLIKAESAIKDALNSLIKEEALVDYNQIIINNNNESKIEAHKEKLLKLDKKLERYKHAFSEGIDTIEEYRQNKQSITNEKEFINQELKLLKQKCIDKKAIKQLKQNMKNLLNFIDDTTKSDEEKNMAIKLVINKIVFNKVSNEFRVFFNF